MSGPTERLFIAAALQCGDMQPIVLNGVHESWFRSHREEWQWVESYWRQYRVMPSPDVFATTWQLVDPHDGSAADLPFLIDKLRDDYLAESMAIHLTAASKRLGAGDSAAAVLDELNQFGTQLAASASGDLRHESALTDDWTIALDEVTRRWRRRHDGLVGIPTGFRALDAHMGGAQPGELWVVAARISQGKSWTLIKMASQAVLSGHRVQYDTLEMSRAQMALRAQVLMARELGMQPKQVTDLIHGVVDLPKYEHYTNEIASQIPGVLIINDTPRDRVTVDLIAAQVQRNRPDVVYVDYITLMKKKGVGDAWQEVADISGGLKSLAIEEDIPIIVAAQMNRAGAVHEMPGMEHLAESDSIGRDADAVIVLKQESKHVTKMKLDKWRHGRDGVEWYCEFRPNTGHFTVVDKDTAFDLIDEDKSASDALR